MKMKVFAMLAITGLVATSFQAMADDTMNNTNNTNNTGSQMTQPPADTSNNQSTVPGTPVNPTDMTTPSMPNSTTNDQGSPDTATGDDDY